MCWLVPPPWLDGVPPSMTGKGTPPSRTGWVTLPTTMTEWHNPPPLSHWIWWVIESVGGVIWSNVDNFNNFVFNFQYSQINSSYNLKNTQLILRFQKKSTWHNEVQTWHGQFLRLIWRSSKTLKMFVKRVFEQFWWPSYVMSKLTSVRFEPDCVKFFFLWTSLLVLCFQNCK